MRHLIPIILNLLTIIGGHFWNNRWERGVLFFTLIFIWCLSSFYIINMLSINAITEDFNTQKYIHEMRTNVWILPAGLAFLNGSSLLLLLFDLRVSKKADITKKSLIGLIGSILLSLIVLIIFGFLYLYYESIMSFDLNAESKFNSDGYKDTALYEYIYYGGGVSNFGHKKPPVGNGKITGTFKYQNKPAIGVRLNITLNNKYQVNDIITDDNGRFTINIAPSEWHLNVVQVKEWANKPTEIDMMILNGREEKLTSVNSNEDYHKFPYTPHGVDIFVPENGESKSLDFTIVPRIVLNWPPPKKTNRWDSISASHDTDTIKWGKVKKASKYRLIISSVTKKGNIASSTEIYKRILVDANEYPLSNIETYKRDGVTQLYKVKIQAFNSVGEFIGESIGHSALHNILFKFEDNALILDDKYIGIAGESFSTIRGNQIQDTQEQSNAVSTLIKLKLFTEADKLLKKLNQDNLPQGEHEGLMLYLLAASGKCQEAENHVNSKIRSYSIIVPKGGYIQCK